MQSPTWEREWALRYGWNRPDQPPPYYAGRQLSVRKVEIRDRHLLINGERVRLTGMARHEDSPWEGLAESAGTMRHDYDDM